MDTIEEWAKKLRESNRTVIVEGPKDKRALEHFGIYNIVTLSKKPIFATCEDIAANTDQAVILTDYDRKGKELYGKLYKGLQKLGVGIDNRFRLFLYKKRLSHIEGLVTFAKSQA